MREIQLCEAVGAIGAALVMAYVCMDTLTYLALPAGRKRQKGEDFIAWVDTYLKGHPDQLYQYRGLDVYAARCAVLHTYGVEADVHRQFPDALRFTYHNGGKHMCPGSAPGSVCIGTASFLNDVRHAAGDFVEACAHDPALRARVAARLPRA